MTSRRGQETSLRQVPLGRQDAAGGQSCGKATQTPGGPARQTEKCARGVKHTLPPLARGVAGGISQVGSSNAENKSIFWIAEHGLEPNVKNGLLGNDGLRLTGVHLGASDDFRREMERLCQILWMLFPWSLWSFCLTRNYLTVFTMMRRQVEKCG